MFLPAVPGTSMFDNDIPNFNTLALRLDFISLFPLFTDFGPNSDYHNYVKDNMSVFLLLRMLFICFCSRSGWVHVQIQISQRPGNQTASL